VSDVPAVPAAAVPATAVPAAVVDVDAARRGQVQRNTAILAVLTLISRVGGLVRDFMITHFFGASGATDVFYMAFTIPNVLRRLVAEGTMTTVVQPAYQQALEKEGPDRAREVYRGVFAFVVIGIVGIAVAGVVFAEPIVLAFASGFADKPEKLALTIELTRWLFPVVIAMGLVGLMGAALNAHDEYVSPALSPIILNVSMIVFTVVGAYALDPPIFGVVVGALVGALLQVLVQLPALKKRGLLVAPAMRFDDPTVKFVMRGFIPGLFGLAVYQINIIVLRQLASHMAEGSVSYYYTSDRLMELTNGVFAIAIAQASFTSMNKAAAQGDFDALKKAWRYSFELANLVAIPAALGLAVLAEPIISVLFLHGAFTAADVQQTALNVTSASFGLVFTATVRGTSQIFAAINDRVTPVVVGVVVVAVNAAVGYALFRQGVGVHGLSLTLAISSAVQALLLLVLATRKIGPLGVFALVPSMLKKVILAGVACGAAYGVALLGDWPHGFSVKNLVVLAAAIGVAVGLYGVGAAALKLSGADEIAQKVLRRVRRRR
jgi:putative peptidoglycan lipid II flippase